MNTVKFSFLVLFILLWIPNRNCLAQFETTIGSLSGSDAPADIKILTNGRHTAVLATTSSFGSKKILLMELDPTGNVLWSNTINDINDIGSEFYASALELDLDDSGNHIGYFIAGSVKKLNEPEAMILIRTDLNANPLWVKKLIYTDPIIPNIALSARAVSIERQSNGDVSVVGHGSPGSFIVARFSRSGLIRWSNQYNYENYTFFPNESCNARKGGQELIAVVGHIHHPLPLSVGHTFISCIKANNGTEVWRKEYRSDLDHDDGIDLVQDPVSSDLFIAGQANNVIATGSLDTWVFSTNINTGTLTSGTRYNLIEPYGDFVARDICLSPDLSSQTITGFLSNSSGTNLKTFIMNLPLTPLAFPNYAHFFTNSNPADFFFDGEESIVSTSAPYQSYALSTQSFLAGSAIGDFDVHILRLDNNGMNRTIDCPVENIFPHFREVGSSRRLHKNDSKVSWKEYTLITVPVNLITDPCLPEVSVQSIEAVRQKIVATASSPKFNSTLDILLHQNTPNPFVDYTLIAFDLPNNILVSLIFTDIHGKLIKTIKKAGVKGVNQIRINKSEFPGGGIYYYQLQSANFRDTKKLLVLE